MNALQTLSPDAPTDTLLLSDDEWSLLATAIEYPICQLICAEVEMPRQIDEAERRLRVLAGSRKVRVLRLADFKDDAGAALAAAREASQPSDQPHAAPALILIRDDEWSVGTPLPEDELRRVLFWRVMNLLRESWHAIPAQIVFFLSPSSYRALTTHADHLKRWVALKLHFRAITKSPHSTSSLELDPGWDRPGNTLLQVNLETARQQLQFLPRVLEEAMQRGDSREVITRRYRMPLFLAAVTANEYVLAKQLRDQIPLDILRPEEHSRWLEANAELELATGNPTAALSLARELRQRSTDSKDRNGEVMAVILSARALARVGETASAEEELKEAVRTLGSLDDSILVALKAERADVLQARGQLDEALRIRRDEQLPVFERLGDVRSRAVTLGKIADVLQARGQLDEALRIRRDEQLPVYERLGDVRERAVTLGQIADVLQARGQLDEALRIRRDEELPVYERLGDVRSRAVTLGKIADVLQARGQLDEALRIRRDEELPVYERLGDVRSRAVTLGQIADVLQARGQLDKALRIRRDEELPVYERLGDVRSRAITLGKIADVLQARGQLDEALRIRRDDVLPVFERLGDVRELIVCRANLALGLLSRGHPEDAPEVVDHLLWSYREAKAKGIAEAQQLEGILKQLAIHQAIHE